MHTYIRTYIYGLFYATVRTVRLPVGEERESQFRR
jgi:hypothetical protein